MLTGSWSSSAIVGSSICSNYPQSIYPYSYANISGAYVNGKTLGEYVINSRTSASYSGEFIDGNLLGSNLSLQ